jgi:hypothetical protein
MTKWQLILYEFLAYPAHLWLSMVAWLMGGQFESGPTDDDGNIIKQENVE